MAKRTHYFPGASYSDKSGETGWEINCGVIESGALCPAESEKDCPYYCECGQASTTSVRKGRRDNLSYRQEPGRDEEGEAN